MTKKKRSQRNTSGSRSGKHNELKDLDTWFLSQQIQRLYYGKQLSPHDGDYLKDARALNLGLLKLSHNDDYHLVHKVFAGPYHGETPRQYYERLGIPMTEMHTNGYGPLAQDDATKAHEGGHQNMKDRLIATIDVSTHEVSEPVRPPMNAEFLLHLMLGADQREAAIGDFLELYWQRFDRFGERRARLWAYCEVVRMLWPVMKRVIAKFTGLVAAGEWVRRHFS
jgi:hypothetical protein